MTFQQITVSGPAISPAAAQLVTGAAPSVAIETLVYNNDVNNTVWLSDSASFSPGDTSQSVPLEPLSTYTFNGTSDVFAQCIGSQTAIVNVVPSASSFFQPPIINGSTLINVNQFFYNQHGEGENNLSFAFVIGNDPITDPYGDQALPGLNIYSYDGTLWWDLNISGVDYPALVWYTSSTGQKGWLVGASGPAITATTDSPASSLLIDSDLITFGPVLATNTALDSVTGELDVTSRTLVKVLKSLSVAEVLTATGGVEAEPTLVTTDLSAGQTLGAFTVGTSGYTLNVARYWLTTEGFYRIQVVMTGTASAVAGTYIFTNPLPNGPKLNCSFAMGYNGTITAGQNYPSLRVSTSGTVEVQVPALNGSVLSIVVDVPLS